MGNICSGRNIGMSNVFRVPLQELWDRDHCCPRFIEETINHITSQGRATKHIFREKADHELEALCHTMEQFALRPDLELTLMAFSMQSVTTFLKKFLRDLPEPVIPKRYQKSMLYTMTNVSNVLFICSDKQDDFDRLLMLQSMLLCLPRPNFDIVRRLLHCLSVLANAPDDDESSPLSLGQILGPIVFRPTIVVSSSRRSRHLEKKRGPVALYDDALDNEDAILSQKCLTFMINHYAALFRENPHRNLGILFSETSKLEEINMENIRRMEHQHMSIEKFKIRAVQRMYARFAMAKFFIAWRSVSATAEQRHSVYKKLHHLKQELEVTRAESLRAERRCTQLETKLDLETFDTNISTATFRKSIPRASAAFLLPVPSPGSRPSFIRQPSLSSPRPRTTTTFAF